MEKTRTLTKVLNASVTPERYVVFALLALKHFALLTVRLITVYSVVVFNIASIKERSFEKTENDTYRRINTVLICLIVVIRLVWILWWWFDATPLVFENGQLGPCRKRPDVRWHIRLEVNSTVPWVSHRLATVRFLIIAIITI